jgi:hypothetical protein
MHIMFKVESEQNFYSGCHLHKYNTTEIHTSSFLAYFPKWKGDLPNHPPSWTFEPVKKFEWNFCIDWLTNSVVPQPKYSIHHYIHKSPLPVPILSQLNPLYTPLANLTKIHSDTILPSIPRSSKRSLYFRLSHYCRKICSGIYVEQSDKACIFKHLKLHHTIICIKIKNTIQSDNPNIS